MTKKIAIIILTFSVLVPGFILSSAASPVFLIQQIFTSLYTILHTTIVNQLLMQTIIMLSIMLTVFIVITILFGRIFCSYACPLGACQELASKILFPSKLNELKKFKQVVENKKDEIKIKLDKINKQGVENLTERSILYSQIETFEKAKPTGTTDENGFLLEKEAFHNVENMLYERKKLTSKKDWDKLSTGMKNYFRRCYPKLTL